MYKLIFIFYFSISVTVLCNLELNYVPNTLADENNLIEEENLLTRELLEQIMISPSRNRTKESDEIDKFKYNELKYFFKNIDKTIYRGKWKTENKKKHPYFNSDNGIVVFIMKLTKNNTLLWLTDESDDTIDFNYFIEFTMLLFDGETSKNDKYFILSNNVFDTRNIYLTENSNITYTEEDSQIKANLKIHGLIKELELFEQDLSICK